MTTVHIKRVYEAQEPSDGYRVLVDKLYPRGIKKENLHYNLWAKDITPSTPLRVWYHENPKERWQEFRTRYMQELAQSPAVKEFLEKIKGQKTITLLFASKNATENHALILQEFLQQHNISL
ncbi:MAG: DUF488 family protein [Bacteroidales bacterium]|jgi:uncharacterized protein YeaO (DUF488 family)|nr:DUF488 family protein [Bacteroidales bacterium]